MTMVNTQILGSDLGNSVRTSTLVPFGLCSKYGVNVSLADVKAEYEPYLICPLSPPIIQAQLFYPTYKFFSISVNIGQNCSTAYATNLQNETINCLTNNSDFLNAWQNVQLIVYLPIRRALGTAIMAKLVIPYITGWSTTTNPAVQLYSTVSYQVRNFF